jgi:SOS-response transcriptional repressor LexA
MKNLEEVLEKLMTEKQRTVFLVIDEYWKRFGYGPSVDDVMMLTGDKGRGNVHRVMKKLIQMGACKGLANSARSIRPTYVSFRKLP